MSYVYLKKWLIFNELDESFCQNVHMAIVCGISGNEAFIVTKDEKVYQLTISGNSIGLVEIKSLTNKKLKTIAYGSGGHILALTDNGEIYGWGNNRYKQITSTSKQEYYQPVKILLRVDGKFIVDVACGAYHSFARTSDGSVYGWGKHYNTVLFELLGKPIISIAGGHKCSLALSENGACYYWWHQETAEKILDVPTPLKKVVCAKDHFLVLNNEGCLYVGNYSHFPELKCNFDYSSQITIKMGFIIDIAAHHCSVISAGINREGKVFILRGWSKIGFPYCTSFTNLHDVVAWYTEKNIMYCPLILETVQKPTIIEDSLQDPVNILECIKHAFNDTETSDLVFKVDEKSIYVHKCFLQMRSIYFRTMFKEEWKNSGLNVIENNVFKYDVYKSFLKYLYTGEVDIEAEHLVELWKAGHLYMEPSLCKRCLSIVKQTMTVENVVTLYVQAMASNCEDLKIICSEFTLGRMTHVLLSLAFQEVDGDIAKDFVINVAKCETFKK